MATTWRLIKRVFWALAIVLATVFAFINLQIVEINLDPLGLGLDSLQAVETPLAYVILGSVALGLVIGFFLSYDAMRPTRRALRDERRQTKALLRENERVTEALKTVDHPDSAGPPVARF